MALFGKKEDKPTTLEEVKKAYENLSDDDKKSFHQSIADGARAGKRARRQPIGGSART